MKALDEVLSLLDRERRRYALYVLQERGGPVSVDELAEQVAAWERGTSTEEVPDDAFEDVSLTLVHHHLPKAAGAEYVEYDPEEEVVRMTGTPREFSVILAVAKAIEQPENDAIVDLRDLV